MIGSRESRFRSRRVRALAGPLLSTLLWAASPAAAAEPPGALELRVSQRRPLRLHPDLARGQIEHRTLSLHGVPVRGAYRTVRTRPDGVVEPLASRVPARAPQRLPSQARIEAAAVPGLVAAHRGQADASELEGPPTLVYLMMLDEPVLAWETQLALQLWPEPTRKTLWLSASTGRVLSEVEQVRSSRARIFTENPAITPEPVEIELVDIDVDGPGEPLVGTRVQAFNCVEVEPEEVSPWWDERECWPVQLVASDANGDFFVPLPDIVQLADNIDASDLYAELSMYVHAERFLDVMQQKGVEEYQCELSSMLANFRSLDPSPGLPFTPLNNAYYTNQCDPAKGPTMLFGQGSEVDFGYDADVIYHELGHGMVALLVPGGLFGRRLRADASLVDASGINEAMADYFSVMLTDDPHLADYVGRYWASNGRPFIRDAENAKTCPANTVGQAHNDGEPLMAGLYATRKRLEPEGKDALDRAVIAALLRMSPDADLEEASALILEMTQPYVQQGSLSGDDYDLLVRSLDARGVLDCPRVITDPASVRAGRTLYLRRADAAVYPFYPGPMQLRYEVPDGADDMVLGFTLRPRGSTSPVEARVLVRKADAPITFEYQLVAVDNPPIDPEDDDAEDPVRELVLVTGDWDLELEATEVAEDDYVLELGGLEPGEVLHIALVNLSTTEAVASNTNIRSSNALPGAEAEATGTGTGGDGDELAGIDEVTSGAGSAGCACRADRSRGPAGALAGLGLLLLGLVGRRRRGCAG